MRQIFLHFVLTAAVASFAVGCASESRPKPAPAKTVADLRGQADRIAADGQRLKDEGASLDARGQSTEGHKRVVEGERKLTEAKMLRDKALLGESPVPAE